MWGDGSKTFIASSMVRHGGSSAACTSPTLHPPSPPIKIFIASSNVLQWKQKHITMKHWKDINNTLIIYKIKSILIESKNEEVGNNNRQLTTARFWKCSMNSAVCYWLQIRCSMRPNMQWVTSCKHHTDEYDSWGSHFFYSHSA